MTSGVPVESASPMRRRGALLAGLAGGISILAGLFAAVWASGDPGQDLGMRRRVLEWTGAALLVVAFVLLGRRGKVRALAVALAVVACMVVVELLLRVFAAPYIGPVRRSDDRWLYEHIPGIHRINVHRLGGSREKVPFDVNSDGLRGPELRARRAPSVTVYAEPSHGNLKGGTIDLPPDPTKRVIVYGDSFIAAEATQLADTYVVKLGQELQTSLGVPVEAINAGVVGYGPDQVCLRMEAELPKLRPDLVVVAVLAENDYGDLVRNRLFDIGADGALVRNHPVLTPSLRDILDDGGLHLLISKVPAMAEGKLRDILQGPPAAMQADEGLEELDVCQREHVAATVERSDTVVNLLWDHMDADVRLVPESESARHKILLMGRVLGEIRDVAKRSAVPLLVLVIPAASDVCKGYDVGAVNPANWPRYRPDNLARPIEKAADALGIEHLDLFGPFTGTDANALYFHGGDTHWNTQGQALAAKLTARRVVERRLLK